MRQKEIMLKYRLQEGSIRKLMPASDFAAAINAFLPPTDYYTRVSVYQWASEKYRPSKLALNYLAQNATGWVKDWAKEMIEANNGNRAE